MINIIIFKLRLISFIFFLFETNFVDLSGTLIKSQRTPLFSSRPRPMCRTRARAHRPTGSLESEEAHDISDDNDDTEDLCPQEHLKALKEGVETFKFY